MKEKKVQQLRNNILLVLASITLLFFIINSSSVSGADSSLPQLVFPEINNLQSCFFGNCFSTTELLLSPQTPLQAAKANKKDNNPSAPVITDRRTTTTSGSKPLSPKEAAALAAKEKKEAENNGGEENNQETTNNNEQEDNSLSPGSSCYNALSSSAKKAIDKNTKTLQTKILSKTSKASIQAEMAGIYSRVVCDDGQTCNSEGYCPQGSANEGENTQIDSKPVLTNFIDENACGNAGGQCLGDGQSCNTPPDKYLGTCTRKIFLSTSATGVCCKRGESTGTSGSEPPIIIPGKIMTQQACENSKSEGGIGGKCANPCPSGTHSGPGLCQSGGWVSGLKVQLCCVPNEETTEEPVEPPIQNEDGNNNDAGSGDDKSESCPGVYCDVCPSNCPEPDHLIRDSSNNEKVCGQGTGPDGNSYDKLEVMCKRSSDTGGEEPVEPPVDNPNNNYVDITAGSKCPNSCGGIEQCKGDEIAVETNNPCVNAKTGVADYCWECVPNKFKDEPVNPPVEDEGDNNNFDDSGSSMNCGAHIEDLCFFSWPTSCTMSDGSDGQCISCVCKSSENIGGKGGGGDENPGDTGGGDAGDGPTTGGTYGSCHGAAASAAGFSKGADGKYSSEANADNTNYVEQCSITCTTDDRKDGSCQIVGKYCECVANDEETTEEPVSPPIEPPSGGYTDENGQFHPPEGYVGCATRANNARIDARNAYSQENGVSYDSPEASQAGIEAFSAACSAFCYTAKGGSGTCKLNGLECTCVGDDEKTEDGGSDDEPVEDGGLEYDPACDINEQECADEVVGDCIEENGGGQDAIEICAGLLGAQIPEFLVPQCGTGNQCLVECNSDQDEVSLSSCYTSPTDQVLYGFTEVTGVEVPAVVRALINAAASLGIPGAGANVIPNGVCCVPKETTTEDGGGEENSDDSQQSSGELAYCPNNCGKCPVGQKKSGEENNICKKNYGFLGVDGLAADDSCWICVNDEEPIEDGGGGGGNQGGFIYNDQNSKPCGPLEEQLEFGQSGKPVRIASSCAKPENCDTGAGESCLLIPLSQATYDQPAGCFCVGADGRPTKGGDTGGVGTPGGEDGEVGTGGGCGVGLACYNSKSCPPGTHKVGNDGGLCGENKEGTCLKCEDNDEPVEDGGGEDGTNGGGVELVGGSCMAADVTTGNALSPPFWTNPESETDGVLCCTSNAQCEGQGSEGAEVICDFNDQTCNNKGYGTGCGVCHYVTTIGGGGGGGELGTGGGEVKGPETPTTCGWKVTEVGQAQTCGGDCATGSTCTSKNGVCGCYPTSDNQQEMEQDLGLVTPPINNINPCEEGGIINFFACLFTPKQNEPITPIGEPLLEANNDNNRQSSLPLFASTCPRINGEQSYCMIPEANGRPPMDDSLGIRYTQAPGSGECFTQSGASGNCYY